MKIFYFLERSQYYDPSIIATEISHHNNQYEMTSNLSTINAPDLTLLPESEKTISTEMRSGFFKQQMAELEPKVCRTMISVVLLTCNYKWVLFVI